MTSDIRLTDLKFRLFPPALTVKDIKDFNIKNKNMVSFSKVNLEIPFTSIFAKEKKINISIIDPKFDLQEDFFKVLGDIIKSRKKKGGGKSSIKLNRISIKNGELIYRRKKLSITLLEFDLQHSFRTSDITLYRLRSPHLKMVFPISKKEVILEGDMITEFKQQRGSWKINRLLWNTEHIKLTMNGRVFKDKTMSLNASIQGSMQPILDPMLKRMSIREFIYGSAKIERDKRGKISVKGQFKGNNFTIDEEKFENLKGNISWDTISRRYKIDAVFNDDSFNTRIRLNAKNKITNVKMENISAEKTAKILGIYKTVPLGGIAKEGDVTVKKGVVSGNVLLGKGELIAENQFNMDGLLNFTYHVKTKALKVNSDEAHTEFGKVSLHADFDPGRQERLTLTAVGDVDKLGYLDKYTGFYSNLVLKPWDLKESNGKINLDVKMIGKYFFIDTNFKIRDFLSHDQEVDLLEGRVTSKKGVTTGYFEVKDRNLTGRAEIHVDKEKVHIDFKNVKGESQKVLRILGFDIDLTGVMDGNFSYDSKPGQTFPLVRGTIHGEKINFYGFDFDNVTGNLESRDFISLKNLQYFYKTGRGSTDIFINFYTKKFDINGAINKININRMHKEFSGLADIQFAGAGSFAKENLVDNDPIHITYKSDNISFFKDHEFRLSGDAKIHTDFSDFTIKPGEKGGEIVYKIVPSPFTIEFSQVKGRYTGNYSLNLKDINLLIPWGNNRGEMELSGQIFSSDSGAIRTEGHAVFKGKFLSFPSFPHALENFEGDLIFKDFHFTLRSLRGTVGGGEVESKGYLIIENDKLKDVFIDLNGKDMRLYPMDRTSCLASTRDLTLKYIEPEDKLLFSGDLNFSSSLWERELDEPISFGTTSSPTTSGSKFIEMLKFDLRLIARQDFQVNNSLLNAGGKFDLRLTGTSEFPRINGTIDCREGYLEMSDNKFELIKARANFNKSSNEASVDLESETFIKNYRIKFIVKGSLNRLIPEFQSSPPLPPRDILTLLSLGELFERPTTDQLRSRVGTGTTGLIAQEITDQIKKRTKKIFGDYVLRVNPNITNITGASVEGSSRVIVGKSIAKDILIVYSTDFSTKRQEVVYVQYQLSPTISLIGMRNEEGFFSIDIRFRKRH